MKSWAWVLIALAGWAVMLVAYASRGRRDPSAPWASGMMAIGPTTAVVDHPPAGGVPLRLRLLSASAAAEMMLFGLGDMEPDKALAVKGLVRVKLLQAPLADLGIGATWLQSGRLPEAGRNEVLAGAKLEPRDTLIVGGTALKVVGVLKPDVALFANSYLIPPGEAAGTLFPVEVPTVLHGWVVRASATELRDQKFRKALEGVFPPKKFGLIGPDDRLEPWTFYAYLAGLAILLLGGSGAIIGLYCALADRLRSRASGAAGVVEDLAVAEPAASKLVSVPWLAAPLLEIKARLRLVWCVHIVYFGVVIACSLLVYGLADVQLVLLGKVREALSTRDNPLGIAAEAYLSGDILRAALVTFVVNFFLGSVASITLPSVLLPGFGAVLAGFRAIMWGLLLAPVMETLAYQMLPHSLTMLLEGEGYILAAFFGVLIPIQIVQSSLGGNPLTRFGRVLLLNLKASFWIALVLAVAAIYEATEVILMNR